MSNDEFFEWVRSIGELQVMLRQKERIERLTDLLESLIVAVEHGEGIGTSFALSEAKSDLKMGA